MMCVNILLEQNNCVMKRTYFQAAAFLSDKFSLHRMELSTTLTQFWRLKILEMKPWVFPECILSHIPFLVSVNENPNIYET